MSDETPAPQFETHHAPEALGGMRLSFTPRPHRKQKPKNRGRCTVFHSVYSKVASVGPDGLMVRHASGRRALFRHRRTGSISGTTVRYGEKRGGPCCAPDHRLSTPVAYPDRKTDRGRGVRVGSGSPPRPSSPCPGQRSAPETKFLPSTGIGSYADVFLEAEAQIEKPPCRRTDRPTSPVYPRTSAIRRMGL
jgi:hypothetical protein